MSETNDDSYDIYAEAFGVIGALEAAGVPYCLVGGLAVALHGAPRYTKDIDVLTLPEAADAAAEAIVSAGFFESASEWTFRTSGVTLRRFAKVFGRQILLTDLLFSGDDAHRARVANAVRHIEDAGPVRVISLDDLVRMIAGGGPGSGPAGREAARRPGERGGRRMTEAEIIAGRRAEPRSDAEATALPIDSEPLRTAAALNRFYLKLRRNRVMPWPDPPVGAVERPNPRRRPRPPWIPAPPPHLDPDLPPDQRAAAYRDLQQELTPCDSPPSP